MVVIAEEQRDQWFARRAICSLGVGEGVLRAAEDANPDLDWLTVVYALDGIFTARGGAMAQVRFLRAHQTTLSGETPLDVLPRPGGPSRVCRAAREYAAA